ncbi:MAG: sulfatase-like hydrolase/transferase [Deltaproteobacteria bacterium]|nr:sulfatase-like hydrolase/transferase [Deltaproteobacteria bacterium]
MGWQKRLVLHPFLFAIFPVLFLFAQNAKHMQAADVALPVAIVLAAALAACLLVNLGLRQARKTGIVVSAFFVLFFSHGHLLELASLAGLDFNPLGVAPNMVLACVWLALLVVCLYLVLRTRSDLVKLTRVLDGVALLLVGLQIAQSGYVLATRRPAEQGSAQAVDAGAGTGERPDIYYIILDGYQRQDRLRALFGYDNRPFLDHLRQAGFYVADRSRSNYIQTLLSLCSSLNMQYLDGIAGIDPDGDDRLPMQAKLRDNEVFRFLRRRGYRIVSFSSGYAMTELHTADVLLEPDRNLSEFQGLLLSTTPLPALLHGLESPFDLQRRRILYTLDKLPRIREARPPRFVFAHVLAPHPPFLFDAQGGPHARERFFDHEDGNHYFGRGGTRQEYLDGYRNQLKVIDGKVSRAIDALLARPGPRPIVILQADHGSGLGLDWNSAERSDLGERFSILNAYLLPGEGKSDWLYPSISPVNTFRGVLGAYFGAQLELLDDRMFYSTWDQPFRYLDVTERLPGSGSAVVRSGQPLIQ